MFESSVSSIPVTSGDPVVKTNVHYMSSTLSCCFMMYICIILIKIKLTLLLTLCGLTSQETNHGGLGLSGSVHEEAHPCFPNFV